MDKSTVKLEDRIFKLCEDVSLAVKEKRKLFWINNGMAFELRCVSENYGPQKTFLFLYENGSMGEGIITHYRTHDHKYNYLLYLDVTPEKRYAVWNKVKGRFCDTQTCPALAGWWNHRKDAELAIAMYWHENFATVVEFDNPDQET